MGRSGNPAKQAAQRTTDDVRAAVKAGKTFLVRPFPHTEVVVKSKDEEEAVEVIKALQPIKEGKFSADTLQAELDRLSMILTLVNGDKRYNQMVCDYMQQIKESADLNWSLHHD